MKLELISRCPEKRLGNTLFVNYTEILSTGLGECSVLR
jgi:hypothetical protein